MMQRAHTPGQTLVTLAPRRCSAPSLLLVLSHTLRLSQVFCLRWSDGFWLGTGLGVGMVLSSSGPMVSSDPYETSTHSTNSAKLPQKLPRQLGLVALLSPAIKNEQKQSSGKGGLAMLKKTACAGK